MENQLTPQQAAILASVETQTPEQIAQHYDAMLESVSLINAVTAGTQMQYNAEQQKKDCVDRNVRHLEMMARQKYWTTEDMASVDAAIVTGNAYLQL